MIHLGQDITSPEYFAVRDGGAGLIDLSARGRFLVSGSEAVQFLNGLITNDMQTLGANQWMPAVFPNVQGRLIASVRVIHRHDGFLIDTESETHERVRQTLERFTLAGDFRLTDLTDETSTLSIQGAKAAEAIRAVDETSANLGAFAVAVVNWQGSQITIIRATHTAEDGFDLFVSANEVGNLRDALTKTGAQPVGLEALETLRIEAGIPRYGKDMDETTVVTETNLDEAVSFTKGCYVGQEIIARIKYRGHVAKKLTGAIFEGEVSLESGAKILSVDEKEIGRITSFAFSPHLKHTIALGYVKYDYLEPGTPVRIVSSAMEIAGQVAELPFIRGSWYVY